jgi:hypothetical protein
MTTPFPGQSLHPGQSLQSNNGLHTLIMQTDGNAVLYNSHSNPLWYRILMEYRRASLSCKPMVTWYFNLLTAGQDGRVSRGITLERFSMFRMTVIS